MRLDDIFRTPVTVEGSKFTRWGLPIDLQLGDPGDVIRGAYTGTLQCFAPVFGAIEIQRQFLFAGAELFLTVRAVVGFNDPPQRHGPAMSFKTTRQGAVSGILNLHVNATLSSFELIDQTTPGGAGVKTVVIDRCCGKLRIVTRGSANRSTYQLRLGAANEDEAAIEVRDGPKLKVTKTMENGWVIYTVSDLELG